MLQGDVSVPGVWGLGTKHTECFQGGHGQQGSGNLLVCLLDRGQIVYRKPFPRVGLWYAGYAIWITGCKIPSKEASWSQWCEAKLMHKEMRSWQLQCDQHSQLSVYGPELRWGDSFFFFFVLFVQISRWSLQVGIVFGDLAVIGWGKHWTGTFVFTSIASSPDLHCHVTPMNSKSGTTVRMRAKNRGLHVNRGHFEL